MEKVWLPITGRNFILDAVNKKLNENSRNQATEKPYPQPEHIFPYASQPNYKNAQKTHHGSEKTSQFHSPVRGGRASRRGWMIRHGIILLPLREIVGSSASQVNGVVWRRIDPQERSAGRGPQTAVTA
jgi:hypothetical protein